MDSTSNASLGKFLFKESWKNYQAKFKQLWLPSLLMAVFISFYSYFYSAITARSGWPLPLNILLALAFLLLAIWLSIILLVIIRQKTNFGVALDQSKKYILPAIIVGILAYLITTGGFVLLIIPGIIMSIWFAFAYFIVIDQNGSGFNALLKSKEYVRGYWWTVFLHGLLIGLLSAVIGYLLTMPLIFIIPATGSATMTLSIIIGLIYALLIPYVMIYWNALYDKFKAAKQNIVVPESGGIKAFFIICAIIGLGVFVWSISNTKPIINNTSSLPYGNINLDNINLPTEENSMPQFDEAAIRKMLQEQGVNLDDLPTDTQ